MCQACRHVGARLRAFRQGGDVHVQDIRIEGLLMARSRNIKPGFFKNEKLGELTPLARLLFAGLWCIADKEGRLEDRPKRIEIELLPYDRDADTDALLQSLHDARLIQRYAVNGQRYIEITKWRKHQTPHHKEVESEIPSLKQADTQDQSNVEPTLNQGCAKENASCPTDSLNLIPDSLHSRRGADAPDPVKEIFETGIRVLTHAGVKEKPARALIGRLRQKLGDEESLNVIRLAASKSDPQAYIAAATNKPKEIDPMEIGAI